MTQIAQRLALGAAALSECTWAVGALACDPGRLGDSGQVLVAASLAARYGFTDVDGKTPRALTPPDV